MLRAISLLSIEVHGLDSPLFDLPFSVYVMKGEHTQSLLCTSYIPYIDLHRNLATLLDRIELAFPVLGRGQGTYTLQMYDQRSQGIGYLHDMPNIPLLKARFQRHRKSGYL